MLDGDHYRTAELINQLMNNASMKAIYDLIDCLKPELIKSNDGSKWIYNYQNKIIAEGNTVYEAMMNFNALYYNQKP